MRRGAVRPRATTRRLAAAEVVHTRRSPVRRSASSSVAGREQARQDECRRRARRPRPRGGGAVIGRPQSYENGGRQSSSIGAMSSLGAPCASRSVDDLVVDEAIDSAEVGQPGARLRREGVGANPSSLSVLRRGGQVATPSRARRRRRRRLVSLGAPQRRTSKRLRAAARRGRGRADDSSTLELDAGLIGAGFVEERAPRRRGSRSPKMDAERCKRRTRARRNRRPSRTPRRRRVDGLGARLAVLRDMGSTARLPPAATLVGGRITAAALNINLGRGHGGRRRCRRSRDEPHRTRTSPPVHEDGCCRRSPRTVSPRPRITAAGDRTLQGAAPSTRRLRRRRLDHHHLHRQVWRR